MISNHPENGDTALVIGRGGALRSARCLTGVLLGFLEEAKPQLRPG